MTRDTPNWQPTDTRIAVVFFLVATLLAAAYVLVRHNGTLDEEPRVGTHLALGHGFRTSLDPSPTAEFTAWVPPGYPMVCAAVYKVLGVETPAALKALLLINAVAFGALVGGAFTLGRLIFGRPVGVMVAGLLIIHPLFILRLNYFWHTYIVQAMLMWLAVWAIAISRSSSSRGIPSGVRQLNLASGVRPWKLASFGALLGVLVLFNGSFILVAPVLGWLAVRHEKFPKQVAMAVISAGCFLLVITPWTVRNYATFDKLMYIRRGAELEMWIGNLRGSNGWQDLSIHPSIPMLGVTPNPENLKMREMGEAAYFKYCGERFKAEYDHDPSAYWVRTVRRVGYLFVGPMSAPSITQVRLSSRGDLARFAFDWMIFAPACLGLIFAYRLGYKFLWIIPLSLMSTIPYLFSHVNYRFTLHIRLLLLMAACFLVWAIYRRIRSGQWPTKGA